MFNRVLVSAAGAFVLAAGALAAIGAPAQAAPAGPSLATPMQFQHSCAKPAKAGQMSCFALRRTDAAAHPNTAESAVTPAATANGYGPTDLRNAYKLGTGGAGATVAIVDAFDDPNAESDLATYRANFGLPACTTANGCFKKVNQNGAASPLPASDTGWAGEISLDVDMVSAICPSCHILLVEASSADTSNLFTAIGTAVSQGAKFVSNSWGGPEDGTEPTLDSVFANHPGVAFTASTGDDGTGTSYPATSPYVTAVGGTSLVVASGTSRGYSETAWNGAGSGCSASESKPSWQQSVPTGCARRAEADIAAVANPNTGVAVYQTFGASGWNEYGGTSVASPIIASVYALAGTPGASDHPVTYPYAHSGNLFDVVSGSNGTCGAPLCSSIAGWDGPTGLGTPNGTGAFVADIAGVSVTNPGNQAGIVPVATSLALHATGGTGTYTWGATGLPAGLSLNTTTGVVSGTPTTAGTFTVTITATSGTLSGTASFTWTISPVGGCVATQLLGNPSFESASAAPWTTTAAVINVSSGTDAAHTGTHFAWLNGYGTTHTDTVSQKITIPATCHSASLSFWLYISTAETTTTTQSDKLNVTANGTSVATFSNLNHGAYALHTVSLNSFIGTSVTITFTGTENASLQTSFELDDTAVQVS